MFTLVPFLSQRSDPFLIFICSLSLITKMNSRERQASFSHLVPSPSQTLSISVLFNIPSCRHVSREWISSLFGDAMSPIATWFNASCSLLAELKASRWQSRRSLADTRPALWSDQLHSKASGWWWLAPLDTGHRHHRIIRDPSHQRQGETPAEQLLCSRRSRGEKFSHHIHRRWLLSELEGKGCRLFAGARQEWSETIHQCKLERKKLTKAQRVYSQFFCSDLILDDRWHSAGDDIRPHDIVGDAQQCDSRYHRWIFARISHLSDAQFASSAWQLANVLLQFVGLKSSRVAHWPCHEPSHVHQHSSRLWGASVWAFCAAASSRR